MNDVKETTQTIQPKHPVDYRELLLQKKVEFSEKAMEEVLVFLKKDNQIIGHFEEILGAVKEDIKKYPDKFYSGSSQRVSVNATNDINGSGFLSDLGDVIKDVIIKDKELVIKIIEKVFGL